MPPSRNTQIILAIIGTVSALGVAAIGIVPMILKPDPPPEDRSPLLVTITVLDSENVEIEGAKASLAIGPVVQESNTDSLGRHTFEVPREFRGRVATISASEEKFLPRRIEVALAQPEETRRIYLIARKHGQLSQSEGVEASTPPKKDRTKQTCPTEEERKCESVVFAGYKKGWVWLDSCDIAVHAPEHKVPDSVYFIEVTANDHLFPQCTGPAPKFFGLMDKCPFKFNGKKWYATLDSVRDLGNNSYDAAIRLRRDCRYP